MTEDQQQIEQLQAQLDNLVRTQIDFQREVSSIRSELDRLRSAKPVIPVDPPAFGSTTNVPPVLAVENPIFTPPREPVIQPPPHEIPSYTREIPPTDTYSVPPRTSAGEPSIFGDQEYEQSADTSQSSTSAFNTYVDNYISSARANLEKFIGENLINKIGILVLVLGVGIGAKYAIDNELISPIARIVVAYIFGFGLIGLAIRLKPKYHNFSAVLVSGGMAIMYFVTYFAYAAYALINQPTAFVLMTIFTVFTVSAAIIYDRQVIAHVGLVGAYAVPFLLSNNSGNYLFLYSYMTVLNGGILAVSVRKGWKALFYTSFGFTWPIFGGWLASKYSAPEHFYLALVFLGVFTAFFLGTRLIPRHRVEKDDDKPVGREKLITVGLTVAAFYCCLLAIGDAPADPTRYTVFLTFLAASTLAILAITMSSFRKVIYSICFAFVWLAFGLWMADKYSAGAHFYLALVFLAVFATIFFAISILQRLYYEEPDENEGFRLYLHAAPVVAFYCFFVAVSNVDTVTQTYAILFSYLAAITIAFITISFRYYGKVLIFVCYPLVWLAFGVWMAKWYAADSHFALAFIFAVVFFAIFYLTAMIVRLRYDELTLRESTAITLTNSFLFYGLTYNVMHSRESLHGYLGLLTAGHGVLHLVTANIVSRIRSSSVDTVQMLVVLVLTFTTITIPVQFDGNRITLIWAVEGALLFWFGRVREVRTFEYYSYPVMLLAICSLVSDWGNALTDRLSHSPGFDRTPLMNGDFVTGLVFVAAFFFVFQTNRDKRNEAVFGPELVRRFGGGVAAVAILVLYNTFRVEIANYFHLQTLAAGIISPMSSLVEPGFIAGYDIVRLNAGWQLVYSMFFLIGIAAANLNKARSAILAFIGVILGVLALGIFSTAGMYLYSQMRIGYMLHGQDAGDFVVPMNILIRYISYFFAAGLLFSVYRTTRDELLTDKIGERKLRLGFDALLYPTVLIAASCDVVNVMAQLHLPDANRWGLSILWGTFALGMIVIGIAWNKAHLRIAAICLLAVTLVKLFFYDISELGTIPKTILFVSLGILLLIVSFLYNKYKSFIFGSAIVDDNGPLP